MNIEEFKPLAGQILRRKRIAEGKTIERLAEEAGLDPDHLGKLERGENLPGLDTFFKLVEALNITPDHVYIPMKEELGSFLDKERE